MCHQFRLGLGLELAMYCLPSGRSPVRSPLGLFELPGPRPGRPASNPLRQLGGEGDISGKGGVVAARAAARAARRTALALCRGWALPLARRRRLPHQGVQHVLRSRQLAIQRAERTVRAQRHLAGAAIGVKRGRGVLPFRLEQEGPLLVDGIGLDVPAIVFLGDIIVEHHVLVHVTTHLEQRAGRFDASHPVAVPAANGRPGEVFRHPEEVAFVLLDARMRPARLEKLVLRRAERKERRLEPARVRRRGRGAAGRPLDDVRSGKREKHASRATRGIRT